MLDRIRTFARRTEPSTRVLCAAVALMATFTAVAVAAHLRPAVAMPIEGSLFFAVTAAALWRARFDRGVILILLAGLGLYLVYLGYTSFGERNYDGGPQLDYIKYIVQHKKRPPAATCLICHHPPLYYAASAVVYAFFQATRLADPAVGVQIFGLALFMVFLAFGARTAERLLPERRDVRLATALMVFWPYSVHNSVRLHNDSMVCAWMAIAVYYVVRWAQEERPRDLYLGALFTALGLLTKSSAYAIVPVFAVLLAVRFFRSRDKLRFLARGIAAASILAGALALNARGKETPQMKNAPLCHKILGNACDIHEGQFVGNDVVNYVWLDLKPFLQEPYALAQREGSGRQYFWNHFLKSSLFGTHNTIPDRETSYELNRVVAAIMNVLLLGMILYLVIGLATAEKRQLGRWGVVMLNLASCVAFMMGFRVLIPAPHHSDFRHVFHAVILVSIAYAGTVAHFRRKELALEWGGRLLAVPFVLLSIFYFLPKYDLAIRLTRRVVHQDLAAWSKEVPEGTPWDKETNLVIEGNHIVEFKAVGRPVANEVDVTFDNNDRYEIEIEGDATRKIVVGPAKKKVSGLARYVERVDPPVRGVRGVRVRALSGDTAYTMGHLIIR